MNKIFGTTLLLTVIVSNVHAKTSKKFESGKAKIHLVELYSSEGCSSCPPAEKWMRELRTHPGLWKSFVPVEFHVDYWNQLGWIDPFSTRQFSNRQRKYASSGYSRGVYTPEFFRDGREWRRRQNKELMTTGTDVGRLVVQTLDSENFEIQFYPSAGKTSDYELHGALLGNGLKMSVPAGENAGRTLKHEFVALDFKTKTMKNTDASYRAVMKFSKPKKARPTSYSIAFWVTKAGGLPRLTLGSTSCFSSSGP